MTRRRIDVPGGIHHVMNRGVNRQPVFFADPDRVEFGVRLAAIHALYGVETLAYCLMDNHYHLLLHTPDGRLSEAMQHLGSTYTRHTNARVGISSAEALRMARMRARRRHDSDPLFRELVTRIREAVIDSADPASATA